MEYRWLHISDLHSISKGVRTDIMRYELIEEVKYINQQSPFSFILITGDISDKNCGYDEARVLIHNIAKEIDIDLERVFIVPGNHDLDRHIPENRDLKIKEGWDVEILEEREMEFIETLLPGQDDFFTAYKEILGREYPRDKIHFFYEIDENISIIHLNTAWMCYDSENESGKLHIGLNSVDKCLSDEVLQAKPIKIAIGHHSINDFNTIVKNHLRSLFKTKDVDLYLGGHYHKSTVIYDPLLDTEFCSCRQARAEDADYPAGFIVGDINTENDQNSFQFYNWDRDLAKWTYDYTVDSAKHGKYYLRGKKFTKESITNRDIIVDLKLFGIPLDYEKIMNQFNIQGSAVYRSSVRDIRPKNQEEWNACIKELSNIYNDIIKDCSKYIHIFPIALIPLLVSFGFLIQNDNSNIRIYQYNENCGKWVFDEQNDEIPIIVSHNNIGSNRLALALSVSDEVKENDIKDVLGEDYDLLRVGIEDPKLSKLNYHKDVLEMKLTVKRELDKLKSNYSEIHLFLAAPAGLCIEIGRIIRENMYPDTFVYNFVWSDVPRYSRVFNLKELRSL